MRALIFSITLLLGVEAFSAAPLGVQYEPKDVTVSWQTPALYVDGTSIDQYDIREYELEAIVADVCEEGQWLTCETIYSWLPDVMIATGGRYYYVLDVLTISIDPSVESQVFLNVPSWHWILSMKTIMKNELESEWTDYVVLSKEFFLTE